MSQTVPTASATPLSDAESKTVGMHNFRLNHPKNYLAVPLAVVANQPTDTLIQEYAVDRPGDAKREARELNLINDDHAVTELGEAVVTTASRFYNSEIAALEAFKTLHGSPRRFVDALPEWESIARRVAFQYPATRHLVEFLRRHGALRLSELAWLLWTREPKLATDVFLHPSVQSRYSVEDDSTLDWSVLASPDSYRSTTIFQFKAALFHSGILKSRGNCTTALEPDADIWHLDE